MKKHYFELDKVDSITITMERETLYRWCPDIPAEPKTFLGIKYGMTEAIPAGWNDCFDEDGNEYCLWDRSFGTMNSWDRKQSSYFDDYPWYKVCDITKRIYNKAHVEIRFGYKQSLGINFDSNEEAQAYVDDLISSSEKQFHVIINK
jgi:hypothetical protein